MKPLKSRTDPNPNKPGVIPGLEVAGTNLAKAAEVSEELKERIELNDDTCTGQCCVRDYTHP